MILVQRTRLCYGSKNLTHECCLSNYISSFYIFDLSFSHPIHCLDPAQSFSGTVKRLEPHHQLHNPLDVPMILFNVLCRSLNPSNCFLPRFKCEGNFESKVNLV